jgi:hypothetical protein
MKRIFAIVVVLIAILAAAEVALNRTDGARRRTGVRRRAGTRRILDQGRRLRRLSHRT